LGKYSVVCYTRKYATIHSRAATVTWRRASILLVVLHNLLPDHAIML